jgi:uroporphyrin-III C-methyltransferase
MFEIDFERKRVLVVGRPNHCRHAAAAARMRGADVTVEPAPDAIARLDRPALPFVPDLMVWVDGTEDERERLLERARVLRIATARAAATAPDAGGHVTLVGGGPGDASLITAAGLRALETADVVLHDRLGPRQDLHLLAPAAELIDVGKTPGHHAVPQYEIERIMIEKALLGMRVVRLKGGDPFVFGRGGEEVLACRRAGVPAEVIPGITSAISVPGEAGIPVTQREVSRAFTVISGHVPLSESELAHAVGLGGTLVILMGVATLPHLSAGLRRHGMRPDMPLAIIERGFSPDRRTTVTTLGEVVLAAGAARVQSPAVIVIGEVVMATEVAEFAAAQAGFA